MNETRSEAGYPRYSVRPEWCLLAGILFLGMMMLGCTDSKPKVYRVGIVCGADLFRPVIDGLKTGMAELGFKEGENITYDVHTFNDDAEGELRAAEKLVSDKVDLIVTTPTQPSVMAHRAIQGTDIPLVFSYAGIEGTDLVESVPHPGGNVTGVRFPGPEQICKRLELLQALLPEAKRVWIGYDQNYPAVGPSLEALRPLAVSMGVTLLEAPVTTLEELEKEIEKRVRMADPGLDAIMLMPDTLNHSSAGWEAINTFAGKLKIPVGGSFYYTAAQGALYCNGNEMVTVGELTAPLAAKVLNGTPAGSIPVVSPEQVLTINHRVAGQLGLEVPYGLMNMASRIIR